jgi:uncharacterized protein (UPF0335 family)
MSNTSSARSFQEAQAALASIDAFGLDAEIVRYIYTGRDRDNEILNEQEAPLPTWYPTGRTYRGLAY